MWGVMRTCNQYTNDISNHSFCFAVLGFGMILFVSLFWCLFDDVLVFICLFDLCAHFLASLFVLLACLHLLIFSKFACHWLLFVPLFFFACLFVNLFAVPPFRVLFCFVWVAVRLFRLFLILLRHISFSLAVCIFMNIGSLGYQLCTERRDVYLSVAVCTASK